MRPVECHRHGPVWMAYCTECREARSASLALPAVQSCTVLAFPRVPEQRGRRADAAGLPLVRVGRTHP